MTSKANGPRFPLLHWVTQFVWVLLTCSLAILASSLFTLPTYAFPPAPHHTFYGLIRDEYGRPLNAKGVEVFLVTPGGRKVKTTIIQDRDPSVNYRLDVPMDSGFTDDIYKPTALMPASPFRVLVKIVGTTFLPIEMKADGPRIGQPGKSTRMDLTLGEDLDQDGLPDAWERALIALTGTKKTLVDIKPTEDDDKDGLKNLDEYIAGTFAFDPKDGFALKIARVHGGRALLRFTGVPGRTYRVHASNNLVDWFPVNFKVVSTAPNLSEVDSISADQVRPFEIEVDGSAEIGSLTAFRLTVK